mgnify:FL=1
MHETFGALAASWSGAFASMTSQINELSAKARAVNHRGRRGQW